LYEHAPILRALLQYVRQFAYALIEIPAPRFGETLLRICNTL